MGSTVAAKPALPRVEAIHARTILRRLRPGLWLIAGVALLALELRGFWLQASLASWAASRLDYTVGMGPSSSIRFPRSGPYDRRLGYTKLTAQLARLEERDFRIASQARLSPALLRLGQWGINPIYREKDRAGLRIEDRTGSALFEVRHPQSGYRSFLEVPELVGRTLLFIENQELLEPGTPRRNPAIEWDRLAKALSTRTFESKGRHSPGGSTLATQIEKYRHSPHGRTASAGDKLRQIGSATLRAYRAGPNTLASRQDVVIAYLNTVPLAAAPGFGEVHGLGDGLFAWYGTELADANRLLSARPPPGELTRRARIYKQVLSLFVAERRPSHYLIDDREALRRYTDFYLRLLYEARVIDGAFRDAALAMDLEFRDRVGAAPREPFVETKAIDAVRAELLALLGESRLYDLDRLDLTVETSVDGEVQAAVTHALTSLADPEVARRAGLLEPRLLAQGDPARVVYSLLVFERGAHGNALRVLADTLDRPFSVNGGMKLDLGSTAKLRTLVHYLQIVADLHRHYSGFGGNALAAETIHPNDRIRIWVRNQLSARPDLSVRALLDAALDRSYSADPHPRFFTGGGVHHFRNYDSRHDSQSLSLREAFSHSVNLPFIRLMRDIVNHLIFGPTRFAERLEGNPDDPWRAEYLSRFARAEGRVFLERFYALHRHLTPAQRIAALQDRAYRTGVHPLELWLVGYLEAHPEASLREVFDGSREACADAYTWLLHTRNRSAQNRRIRELLEREAFAEIHRAWQRLGYPFRSLVPSLATAIGVSADRPAALAELMGILQNQGRRLPVHRVEGLRFAMATPYETNLRRTETEGEQVLHPDVAAAARDVLFRVTQVGTARRLRGSLHGAGSEPVPIGGKTGTGDNRYKVFTSQGRLAESRVLSRTASFAFVLGERHFGVITAYVDGPEASAYEFTSALPLQVLRTLEPALAPLLAAEVELAAGKASHHPREGGSAALQDIGG